ncbi:MAG: hypothetical protein SGI77_03720 [Pirellulaceae bacterium]|nr:hypothetical protein [Pirellulaceae bacterium]
MFSLIPKRSFSKSSGLPCAFGYTPERLFIIVIYEVFDADTVYPVSAYEVDEG